MEKASAEIWRERIERQQASGLGVGAWCAEQGLKRKTMWAWRRRLSGGAAKPRRRGGEARRRWQRLLAEQAASGSSVAAFCRGRGLCAPHFFQWKKKLAAGAVPAPATFVPVKLAPAAARGMAIELILCGGRKLRIKPGFEREHLLAVVEALERGR